MFSRAVLKSAVALGTTAAIGMTTVLAKNDLYIPDVEDLSASKVIENSNKLSAITTTLSNPGKYDELDSELKQLINTEPIDGAKIELSLLTAGRADKQSKLDFTCLVGNPEIPTGYILSSDCQVVFPNLDHVLYARYDNQGSLSARHMFSPLSNVQISTQVAVGAESSNDTLVVEGTVRNPTNTVHAKYVSTSQAPMVAVNYLQSVTNNVSIGTEIMHQPSTSKSIYGFKAAIKTDDSAFKSTGMLGAKEEFTATISSNATINMNYFKRTSNKVSYGTEIDYHIPTNRSMCNVAYRYQTPYASHTAILSSMGYVQGVLEIAPLPVVKVTFSGVLDHMNDKSKVGVGFRFGAVQPNYV